MNIQRVDQDHAGQTVALLDDRRMSLLGIHSRRLHTMLANDGVDNTPSMRLLHSLDGVCIGTARLRSRSISGITMQVDGG
jgi:hypothetical protein